jgi:aspartate beta-hydroxylase
MDDIKKAIWNEQWRAADTRIHEYLKHEPNDPDALMYLGVSKAAQGYEPEGEHHILASLTFNPRNKTAYYYLGIIVLEQGRCILASEAFKKGLSIDPTNHALQYQLGRALERLGNSEEALDAYRQSLSYSPDRDLSDNDFSAKSKEAIRRLKDSQNLTEGETCEE